MVLGQALAAGSVVQGEKPRVWVKPGPARVWSEERNYGLWSNAGGGKYGPGGETAGLGQAQPHPSVVRGEKLWSWVKHWWREMWSRERNCGFGSSLVPPRYGPGSKTVPRVTPALPRRSVVQGEKLRVWVKRCPARVWSRERNYGLGSSAGGGKYGPGSQTAAPGHPCPARAWSEERNYGLGSNAGGGKYGPGRETAGLGQALPRPSVVQGEKLWSWVKRWWREVWSREPNCGPGSPLPRPSMVRGEKLWSWVKRWWREVWSRERNCGFGSSTGGGKHGLGSKTVPLGQAQPRPSVVQGAKLRVWVKPSPARVWSEERNYGLGSSTGGGKHGLGSKTAAPGQAPPEHGPRI